MTFSSDGGGFAFSCGDAKLSIGTSTWGTRLSQLARTKGAVYIMTGMLPDPDYIKKIIEKRPHDIYIIASTRAEVEARSIKSTFPQIKIALHQKNNAKVVLVYPDTVWVSSSDFGETTQIESTVGLHSEDFCQTAYEFLFLPTWKDAVEL